MYQSLSLKAQEKRGLLPIFSLKYFHDITLQLRSLLIVYAFDEHDCIVFHDKELPPSKSYEIRADGIWADMNCEIRGEHWSFSLESFALRVPVDEYLSYMEASKTTDALLIGDRIAFGYELDLVSTSSDDWMLSGDIFIEKDELDIGELPAQFTLS